jgi:hypothetical protein
MDSKLRDKIAEALAVQGVTDGYICDKTKAIADSILSLLAPILADAEKWRKTKEIAKYKGNCGECPNDSLCMEFPTSACYICEGVVNALSEASHGK